MFCEPCDARLTFRAAETHLIGDVRVTTPHVFSGAVRHALHELKFRGNTPLARPLGEALGFALGNVPAGRVWLVPVPLHWRRRWVRGHDQAAALALVAARARPGFRARRVLRRRRPTTSQVGLGSEARGANVRNAFAVRWRYREALAGARVVVVDDVATTGATLKAARDALLRVGVRAVTLAAVAAVLPGSVALARELGDDVSAER